MSNIYSKPTNTFSYVLSSICYPKRNIGNVPKGVALRLRRICDSDQRVKAQNSEYQQYLIARDYRSALVRRHFQSVKAKTIIEDRQPEAMTNKANLDLIVQYNPLLSDLNNVSKNTCLYYTVILIWRKYLAKENIRATYRRDKTERK